LETLNGVCQFAKKFLSGSLVLVALALLALARWTLITLIVIWVVKVIVIVIIVIGRMSVFVLLETAVSKALCSLKERDNGINLIVNRFLNIFVTCFIIEVKFIGNFGSDTL